MFSKINSKMMKHNRWIFALLAAVMIVGLVSFLGQGSLFDLFGLGSGSNVGTVYGKKVTLDDLKAHQVKSVTLNALRSGKIQQNEMDIKQLFDSYAMVMAAYRRGIVVSDEEVASVIKNSIPIFQENGRFSRERYEVMLEYYAKIGITGEMISEALRDMLALTKFQQMLLASVIVTDNEVETFYRINNVVYSYSVATFAADSFKSQVDSKNLAELKAFYDENTDKYMIPAKLDALVAEFPIDNYRDAATALADEDSLVNFYHKNPALFIVKMAADPNSPLPYDQVKDKVKSEFIKANAKWLAEQDARKFAQEAYDKVSDAKDKEATFSKVAEFFSLKLTKTGQFAANAKAAGPFKSELLVLELSKAYDRAPVSNAINAGDSVLVGFVVSREAERHATFNECSVQLRNDYIIERAFALATEAAEKAAEEIQSVVDKKSFLDSLTTRGAKVESFADRKGSFVEGYDFALYLAKQLKVGENSKPVKFENSRTIVLLEALKDADMTGFDAEKEQWHKLCLQDKANKAFAELEEDLIKNIRINEKFLKSERQ